ncbi:MaoC/PaaZ C-terminal domain-containing protein [Fictibacillus macauensis]|uniref:MaoC/PaaZ C-terminal domain-containing protein n=1 Tax=Fictibacillus macauensis TaxID=245160 RepID=UPI00058FD84D|nr:MaoC/PaaZ C-terminal domain-containing protein [Fictibacillus macauensis]
MLGKKRKLGRMISELQVGERLELTQAIEDQDLLLYLGMTNDNNPLFIQHDYAAMTPFKKPIVPQILLTGIITAAVSKYLPGPGSSIEKQSLTFPRPVYHYSKVTLHFELSEVNVEAHHVKIIVTAHNEKKEVVVDGELVVCPPFPPKSITSKVLENF